MNDKKVSPFFKIAKALVKFFYPDTQVLGVENLPDEPCIIVGNHAQMHGPIIAELYFPIKRYSWCIGEMMHLKSVPKYAYKDFWSNKPKYCRWFYKILSYIIAPLSVFIFNNANTIGVYKDAKVISTFKKTVKRLEEGYSIVIFPEHDRDYNNIICDFQDRFIDIARLYYKKTGKEVSFVPMYIAPNLKKAFLGKPIAFCVDNSIEQERERIKGYLMKEITNIAIGLPQHTVVPYRNIRKKYYPLNTDRKDEENEKVGS